MAKILRYVLSLVKTIVLGVTTEGGSIAVRLRSHWRERLRCPVCGRRRDYHDRGCLVRAHKGYGKEILSIFLDELTRKQRHSIEVVTDDGTRWI